MTMTIAEITALKNIMIRINGEEVPVLGINKETVQSLSKQAIHTLYEYIKDLYLVYRCTLGESDADLSNLLYIKDMLQDMLQE